MTIEVKCLRKGCTVAVNDAINTYVTQLAYRLLAYAFHVFYVSSVHNNAPFCQTHILTNQKSEGVD